MAAAEKRRALAREALSSPLLFKFESSLVFCYHIEMKLIQANVWGGRLEPQILKFVEKHNPDIICLQEVIELEGKRSAMFATTEEIMEASGLSHIFMSPVFTFNYMKRKAKFGNCIISKFPLTNEKTIFTGKEHVDDFDFLDSDANMRNLQSADIQLPTNEVLHILNHHGHHINQHKNGDNETMRQCGIIAKEIEKLEGKIIVSGDFNLAPHSESLEQLNHLLTNLSIKYNLETTRTQLTYKKEVCDYIFVSNVLRIKSFEASNEIISDHKALIMEFA